MVSRNSLYIPEAIFYGIVLIPIAIIAHHRGKHGFFAWGYLACSCFLHVVGGIMLASGHRWGPTMLNACIGFLLLATGGIWLEAKRHLAIYPGEISKMVKFKFGIFHILDAIGEGLLSLGHLGAGGPAAISAGWAFMIFAWTLAFIQAIATVAKLDFGTPKVHQMLFKAALFGSICVGIRLIYTALAIAKISPGLLHREGSTEVTICCVIIPEVLATVVYLFVGIQTRRVCY